MIPFVESLLNRVLDAASERRKQAGKVAVRPLPRNSGEEPRFIEIDNSEGESPIHDCIVDERRTSEPDFKRVGWKLEVRAREKVAIELENSAGTRRPRRAPLARVTFRQNGTWWQKDSRGSLRRVPAPDDAGPRTKG